MTDNYYSSFEGHGMHYPPPSKETRMSTSRGSSDEDIDQTSLPPDTVHRTYGIFNTGSHINFRIHAGGSKDPVVYYCNNSIFTPGTPDVELHAGDRRDGPIVSYAKFHNLSSHVTLGLGDPKADPVFEELRKDSKIAHSEYIFETAAMHDATRRKLIWRRTIGKNLYANYACLDGATGKVMAYYASTGNKSMKKVGKLCVTSNEGDQFEQLLLVSFLSIREKESRNAWYTGGLIAGNNAPK